MGKESYGKNQVVGELFEYIGHDCVKSAQVLYKKNKTKGGTGDYFYSINILAS